MKKITSLLNKLKNITPPDIFIRKTLIKIIESNLGFKVSIEKVFFNQKTGIITLKINSLEKTVLFLKKGLIIEKINQSLKENLIKDIV